MSQPFVFSGYLSCLLLIAMSQSGCNFTSSGLNRQGVALHQQGQYQVAMQKFQQAIAHDQTNADGHYNLAATYHSLAKMRGGDKQILQTAERLYHQCLEYNPRHVDCHRALAVLLIEDGRQEDAFTLLKRWAAANPQLADARVELARLYEETGDRAAAKQHLEQALLTDSNNSRAWAALGKLRESSGEYAQALANYQRSYQLNTLQPAVQSRIATLQGSLPIGLKTSPQKPTTRFVHRTSNLPY